MKHRYGRIEVICGSMFSGKTEELLRRIRRAEIAQQNVQVFKHHIDDRYHETYVKSHIGQGYEALPVNEPNGILDKLNNDTTVVAIDEGQFFGEDIVRVVEILANDGIRVMISGLDTDFRGEPFGPMPQLLSLAEEVQKLHAICMVCGEEASRTQRLVNGKPADYDDPIIMVGAAESYEARCREHHEVPRRNGYSNQE